MIRNIYFLTRPLRAKRNRFSTNLHVLSDQTSSYRVPALMLLPLRPTGSVIQFTSDLIYLNFLIVGHKVLSNEAHRLWKVDFGATWNSIEFAPAD